MRCLLTLTRVKKAQESEREKKRNRKRPLFGVFWVLNYMLNTQILGFLVSEVSPAKVTTAPWRYFSNLNATYSVIEISPARQDTFSYVTHPIIEMYSHTRHTQ